MSPDDGPGSDLAHARLVGRTEFLRSLRRARTETNMLVGLGMSALMLVVVTLLAAGGAVAFGDALASLDEFGRTLVRMFAVSLWLLATVVVAFRVIGDTGRIDGEAGILTATSPRSVVLGLLLAELYRLLAYLGLPVLVVAVALGVGTGDPLVTPATLAVAAAVLLTGLPVGYLVGLLALYLSATIPFVRRNRLKLGGVLMVLYLGSIYVFGEVVVVLAETPLAWLADPVLVTIGAGGDPRLAAAALAAPLVVTPATVAAVTRVAVATWYADPVAPENDDDSDTLLTGVDEVLAPLASRPTVSVTRKTLLRARRAPYTLTFALVPAFAAVGYVAQAVQAGEVPETFPVLVAAYAGWAVGSAFTLNPFGDEGALLPVTLSTGVSGTEFVRGRVLAAWLVGVPVTLVVVALAAVAAAVPPWKAVGSLLFGLVFSVGTPPVSVGIGVVFPKFDTRTVLGNCEAVMPSVFAFGLFVLVLLPLGLPAVAALALAGPVGRAFGPSPAVLAAVGVGATTTLCLVAAVPSYLLAVRKFDGYSLP